MRRWIWVLAALPLVGGLTIFVILAVTPLDNPIVYLRGDLATVLLLSSSITSLWALLLIALWQQRLVGREELKQTRADIRKQTAAERKRFLRRLDHEVKNPLMALRAGLANLSSMVTTHEHRDAVTSMETQVVRLSRLLTDLRKLADLEFHEIERRPVAMDALLEEVMMVIGDQPEAADRHLMLTLPQAPWPLSPVPGDRDLLFLAVHNLVDNAVKYTLNGNTIEVRAFEDGANVVIEVADTGPGIPEDELPHVWEELARGYSGRNVAGSGLGLSLVRTVVERHSGQVALRSRAGHGTVFSMRLPTN